MTTKLQKWRTRRAGAKHFTGKPCKHGHVAERYPNGACTICTLIASRARAAAGMRSEDHRKNPRAAMLRAAKRRAKLGGLPFNLTAADIHIPTFCPVFGVKLEIGRGKHSPNSPSLDRLKPSKGYVRGNVHVVSNRANQIKSDATVAELRAIAEWMEIQELV